MQTLKGVCRKAYCSIGGIGIIYIYICTCLSRVCIDIYIYIDKTWQYVYLSLGDL